MISHHLRSIRFMAETIIRKTAGHKRRNQQLSVLRLEIERMEDFLDEGGWAAGELTHLTQIIDGLRSLRTLAHGSVMRHGEPETNREVVARLWLLHDMASFLIEKAEEFQLTHSIMPHDEDVPF